MLALPLIINSEKFLDDSSPNRPAGKLARNSDAI